MLRLFLILALLAPATASAQDVISIDEIRLDRATLHTIGIQMLISGDDDRDATVSVRVREPGGPFRDAPPLFRVHPEDVTAISVPQQLAGTIFDLEPGTAYEVQLHTVDPDGVDDLRLIDAATRFPQRETPIFPNEVAVNGMAELETALANANDGDIITLADGVYAGSFISVNASGTAENPIIIRGTTRSGTIFDGEGCEVCNILEIYGSHIRLERMTIRNGQRAIRFLSDGTTGNVVRNVLIEDVQHGIGSATNQTDFTICDNVIRGRLAWPLVYSDDGGVHADDQGVRVHGDGHVVCHNDISGFGDPMINGAEGGRAYDFHGNDIHEIYADGTELDRGAGNVRLFGNRFTNVYTAISIQPANGGPIYVLRNEVVNVADEQLKLKSYGGVDMPSGLLAYHNTFVSPRKALNLQTPITQHNFRIMNNLFVGPATTENGFTVDWTAEIDEGVFDYNAYFPEGQFWFGKIGGVNQVFDSFAAAQMAGFEQDGEILGPLVFQNQFTAPDSYMEQLDRSMLDLLPYATADAVDGALVMPGINDRFVNDGPDMGARERGCPAPFYGPRPPSAYDRTNLVNCSMNDPMPPNQIDAGPGDPDAAVIDGGADVDAGSGAGGGSGGCGCEAGGRSRGAAGGVLLVLVALGVRRRVFANRA